MNRQQTVAMNGTSSRGDSGLRPSWKDRYGSVLVLAAALLVVVFGLTAFALDIGFIALTKSQMQTASDATALAACLELENGLGVDPTLTTTTQVATVSGAAANSVANANPNGGLDSTYLNLGRDVRFGQAYWDPVNQEWTKVWDVAPYNMVQVTVHRDTESSIESGTGDRPLNTFFGGALGVSSVNLDSDATAALLPGIGVTVDAGSGLTADVLPITLDVETWNALMAGIGTDNYSYNPANGVCSGGSDGTKEVDLYPFGNSNLPPGNRGTLDLGDPNNSTDTIARQILEGLNEEDLSFFGGQLRTDLGPLYISGDTGISAGIKEELEAIEGQPRLLPLFSNCASPGENAVYTVVKFVPVRIMYVKLTGANKRVIIQPSTFVSSAVIRGGTSVEADGYFTKPKLID